MHQLDDLDVTAGLLMLIRCHILPFLPEEKQDDGAYFQPSLDEVSLALLADTQDHAAFGAYLPGELGFSLLTHAASRCQGQTQPCLRGPGGGNGGCCELPQFSGGQGRNKTLQACKRQLKMRFYWQTL